MCLIYKNQCLKWTTDVRLGRVVHQNAVARAVDHFAAAYWSRILHIIMVGDLLVETAMQCLD